MGIFGAVLLDRLWSQRKNPEILSSYFDAWRILRNQRWLLLLTGLLMAATILNSLAENLIAMHAASLSSSHTDSLLRYLSSFTAFMTYLKTVFVVMAYSAISWVFPSLMQSNSLGIITLVFLSLLFVSRNRLIALQEDPEYSVGARFLLRTTFPALVFVFLALIFSGYLQYGIMAAATSGLHVARTVQAELLLARMLVAFVLSIIGESILIAGIAGSLFRIKQGNSITSHTFLQDIARFIMPVGKIYLLIQGLQLIFTLPTYILLISRGHIMGVFISIFFILSSLVLSLVPILFVFVPYQPVLNGSSAWSSIRGGMREWKQDTIEILTFLFAGTAFPVLPLYMLGLASQIFRTSHPTVVLAISPFIDALQIAARVFLAVFLWEFMWARRMRREASIEVAASVD